MSGLSAGVAAVIIAGQVNAAYPTAGNLLELSAIAAVIIGGARVLRRPGDRGRSTDRRSDAGHHP